MKNYFGLNLTSHQRNQSAGFTLIEVMIVVAILGILLAIGVPAYTSYMEKTRRADAVVLLSEAAGEQVRFFTENNRYATKMTEMGYAADTALSENGFYGVSVTASGGTSFTLTAAPVAGEAQENDTKCGSFTINSAGLKGVANASLPAEKCW